MGTLGIVGSGKTTRKNVKLLLNDLAAREEFTKLVVPGDDLLCTDSVKYVVDWAVGQRIPVTVVTTDHYNVDHLIDLKALDGVGVVQNRDPVGRVAEADTVLFAWDEADRDFLTEVIHQVMDNGGYALDLTDQLFPLEDDEYASDNGGGAESKGDPKKDIKEEESVPEEDVKPARRKRRTKAEIAADNAAEETTEVPVKLPESLAKAYDAADADRELAEMNRAALGLKPPLKEMPADELQNMILTVDPSKIKFVPNAAPANVWDSIVPTDEDVLVALKVLRAFIKGA
jgi:hypothetical protein